MQEKTRKLITWISLAVAVLGAVFAIIYAMAIPSVKEAGMDTVMASHSGLFATAYVILLLFVAVALISILYFLVMRVIHGEGKGLLIGLGLLVGVALIAFLVSSGNDLSTVFLEKNGATAGTSKIVGAGCIMVYVLVIGAIAAMVYVEVSKALKKK